MTMSSLIPSKAIAFLLPNRIVEKNEGQRKAGTFPAVAIRQIRLKYYAFNNLPPIVSGEYSFSRPLKHPEFPL